MAERTGDTPAQGRANRSLVLDRLRELDIRPSRRLGQNFLADPAGAAKIVASASLTGSESVLEIGPGLGALTEQLAKEARRVVCVEIDRRLADELQSAFSGVENVSVHCGDALSVDYRTLFDATEQVVLVASLPYAIVGPLIARLLRQFAWISRMTIVVQREVGLRLTAQPNTESYGILSLIVAYHARARVLSRVARRSFVPVPDVESSVVELVRRPPPDSRCSEQEFIRIVSAGFGHRRKALGNSLAMGLNASRSVIDTVLTQAGIDGGRRAETLSLKEFVRIAEVLTQVRT